MNTKKPKRGEIWLVSLDPAIGSEMKKTRPSVIISTDAIGILPIKLVAPITEWKDSFSRMIWQVRLEPDEKNCLLKVSSVDVLQIRSVDTERLIRQIGECSDEQMREICMVLSDITESA